MENHVGAISGAIIVMTSRKGDKKNDRSNYVYCDRKYI